MVLICGTMLEGVNYFRDTWHLSKTSRFSAQLFIRNYLRLLLRF